MFGRLLFPQETDESSEDEVEDDDRMVATSSKDHDKQAKEDNENSRHKESHVSTSGHINGYTNASSSASEEENEEEVMDERKKSSSGPPER